MKGINVLATLRKMGFGVKVNGDELILKHQHCTGCKAVPNNQQALGLALNWLSQSQQVTLNQARKAVKEVMG